ncbi:exodeoxyribonuclease VII large subunit [Bowmanella yangjiangensis]|uniref:Exodeoxyribonuclease 7 large subunit n=1 Tax=Bowmanella yangjiangensis TaxID=2811230 RepID=A0ABS3CNX1_9ALTE|nr:exodeoxyribonuclease VII large subunit [Bowmanella yangjiangensis]MBN7818803.1 exodeoxyribonuclease VII large subunit [Bowmanella yangjiangensis]
MSSPNQHIYTISHLNRHARQVLESEIGQVWVRAEISNFVAASSGHWYFTLKDERAQVRSAMFKNANRRVQQLPKEGDKVLARASISLYEPRGDYQLIVEHMEPEGEGFLKQQFEQLKRKLLTEGLFDQSHKRPLPHPILKVGVVTSPTGAAMHDILTVLKRRNPAIEVILYPSQVQGEQAPYQLIHAIENANQRNEVDVLIVGRGGGSLEDLWCFNDERLARCIFHSNLPVISAVGHEVDVSIADFVADLRAPTPSAAAELVSQDKDELQNRIQQLAIRLRQRLQALLEAKSYNAQLLESRLTRHHPQTRLHQQAQQLDRLAENLGFYMQRKLAILQEHQQALDTRLSKQSPAERIKGESQRLGFMHQSLLRSIQQLLSERRQMLASTAHLLDTVSPLATLSRGYSISLKQGKVVKSVDDVKDGDMLTTKLADGEIVSQVIKPSP